MSFFKKENSKRPAFSSAFTFQIPNIQSFFNQFFDRFLVLFFMFTISSFASAQSAAPPPVFPSIDSNGVNIATGGLTFKTTDLAIGDPASGGLTFSKQYRSEPGGLWSSNHISYISGSSNTCSVVLGNTTQTFTSGYNCTGSSTSDQHVGSSLFLSGSTYYYYLSDGTVAEFTKPYGSFAMMAGMGGTHYVNAYLQKVTKPNGEVTNYNYTGHIVCIPSPHGCWVEYSLLRLESVQNNFGYLLKFEYSTPSPASSVQPHTVTAINTAVEHCDGSNCTNNWPSVTYNYSGSVITSSTNSISETTNYSYSGNLLTAIDYPGTASLSIGYSSDKVSSISPGYGTWNYSYSDSGGERTTTVTNPGSGSRSYKSMIDSGRIVEVTNELSQTTTYQYDSSDRQTSVVLPEGNSVHYTLDSRGNTIETKQVSKTPGSPTDIVTTASYPSTCSNQFTCNKPSSTTDALGFRTDYTYHASHGGLLSNISPALTGSAPVGSGARPTTTYTYAQYQSRYQTASAWVNGTIWRSQSIKSCSTSSVCNGSANETVTTTSYPSSSIPNNLMPTSTTASSGDGAISSNQTMTYTIWGDLKTIDGSQPGSSDASRMYYDDLRRTIGVVSGLTAVRSTYSNGLLVAVESGTVSNQGDTALSSFTMLEKTTSGYDVYARPIEQKLWNGGSVAALYHMNYDSNGRLKCTAVRMNLSATVDACSPTNGGSFGYDRISLRSYNNAGQLIDEKSAYGTSLEQTSATYTYSNNGHTLTLKDARNNQTSYQYDGLDRLIKRTYPGGSYEQFTYDANDRMITERRRDGNTFTYGYNNLGGIKIKDAPGSEPDTVFTYDLFGRLKSIIRDGDTVNRNFDALSRLSSEVSSVLGTVNYQYDSAGRRTQMTYPDGFYVTYGYNNASKLTSILENGATSLASFDYDSLGRRTSLTRGNGVVTSYDYDAASRLDELIQNPNGAGHDVTFLFDFNPAGQMISRTRNNSVYDWTVSASATDNYPAANSLNQYTSALGSSVGYDGRGNLTTHGSDTYEYDYDNRLISGPNNVNLEYDPIGRLHEVAVSGGSTTRFLYDGADIIAEYNDSGTVLRKYVHGPGVDEALVWYEGAGTSNKRWLMADELGSIIGTTTSAGNVDNVNKYDAFGMPGASNVGRFQYTGQIWIEDLGLYHYKARAYNPEFGRFMQTDPIGVAGGMNLYGYVGNDPVNFRDSSGLCSDIYAVQWYDFYTIREYDIEQGGYADVTYRGQEHCFSPGYEEGHESEPRERRDGSGRQRDGSGRQRGDQIGDFRFVEGPNIVVNKFDDLSDLSGAVGLMANILRLGGKITLNGSIAMEVVGFGASISFHTHTQVSYSSLQLQHYVDSRLFSYDRGSVVGMTGCNGCWENAGFPFPNQNQGIIHAGIVSHERKWTIENENRY